MSDRGTGAGRRRPLRPAVAMLVGAVDMTGASIIAAAFVPATWGRLLVLALAMSLFAALIDDLIVALVIAGLGYALFVWFVADRPAHPAWDITGSAVPVLAFGLAVALGRVQRWISQNHRRGVVHARRRPPRRAPTSRLGGSTVEPPVAQRSARGR